MLFLKRVLSPFECILYDLELEKTSVLHAMLHCHVGAKATWKWQHWIVASGQSRAICPRGDQSPRPTCWWSKLGSTDPSFLLEIYRMFHINVATGLWSFITDGCLFGHVRPRVLNLMVSVRWEGQRHM